MKDAAISEKVIKKKKLKRTKEEDGGSEESLEMRDEGVANKPEEKKFQKAVRVEETEEDQAEERLRMVGDAPVKKKKKNKKMDGEDGEGENIKKKKIGMEEEEEEEKEWKAERNSEESGSSSIGEEMSHKAEKKKRKKEKNKEQREDDDESKESGLNRETERKKKKKKELDGETEERDTNAGLGKEEGEKTKKKKKRKAKRDDKTEEEVEKEEGVQSSALQQDLDKELQHKSNFGQWDTAQFDSSERQLKFLRLMGGMKKGNQAAGQSASRFNMALGQDGQQNLQQGLLGEFERAQNRRLDFQNRGAGLGFTATSDDELHIDADAPSQNSTRFDD